MNIKGYSTVLSDHPNLPGEIWKKLDGYSGRYLVSSFGRIWSTLKCRMLTEFPTMIGYIRVNLTINSVCRAHLLHRLIAKTFIPNPNNKPEVNHKDGVKSNNRVDNLAWSTSSENKQHAIKIGIFSIGTGRPDAKINEYIVIEILKDRYINNLKELELEEKYPISRTAIRNIIHGKTWKHVECEERKFINSFTRISEKGKPKKK